MQRWFWYRKHICYSISDPILLSGFLLLLISCPKVNQYIAFPGILTWCEFLAQRHDLHSSCFPHQFGGKLVTFGLPSTPAHQEPQPCLRRVFISQVTTESKFLMQSAQLHEALRSGNLLNYCQNKIQLASLQSEKMLWQFLKVGSLKACGSEVLP